MVDQRLSYFIYRLAFAFYFILGFIHVDAQKVNDLKIENSNYNVILNSSGISSFVSKDDHYGADIVNRGSSFGAVSCKYRVVNGDWLDIYQSGAIRINEDNRTIRYTNDQKGTVLSIDRTFEMHEAYIDFFVTIKNRMNYPVEIGDLSIAIPWANPSGEIPSYIFEQTFVRHQFIGGNGSFIYFTRPSGLSPYFLVSTHPGTKLEYFEKQNNQEHYFIYSGYSANKKADGSWRIKNRMTQLKQKGEEGDNVKVGFRFQWIDSYDDIRTALFENNLLDVRVVPGMTVPIGLNATISLHTKNRIDSVVPEFRDKTEVKALENSLPSNYFYKVRFNKLGENKLTICYNGGEQSILEFFATEPIETLIKKRSKFLVNRQQHKDTTKWYNGLYSIWDMKNKVLRGPDNTDGFDFWWGYVLAADDIGLSKAPFIASKNVVYPDKTEIASVEYYIKNFVWGGLQRTEKEVPFPYAIYGTPNWHEARDSFLRARSVNANLDKMKVYRSYDYPHIIKMYFHMYEIALRYPEMVSYLDAKGYLDRAFNTAKAYFNYPYKILPWYETYKWGCYNEMVIVDLIHALEINDRKEDANWLRKEWEKKVKYFVYDDQYPFRSEYSIDRTAFESSYAFAKYGTLNKMKPDKNLWFDVNLKKWYSHPKVSQEDSREFMDRQNLAGLAVRGWINSAYYTLGSDDSEAGGLSYMARMGGWSILDYGLQFSKVPFDWIQLGYASYLSSFALMNTGNEESGYGYWYPGIENDGAIGWAFNSQKYGRIWLQGRNNPRGAWNYDGEADLGMGAITHTASTLVVEDPIFGWIGYGGDLITNKATMSIVPQDGVRVSFGMISVEHRIIIKLERNQFLENQPIRIDTARGIIRFNLENQISKKHRMTMKLTGTKSEIYEVRINNKFLKKFQLNGAAEIRIGFIVRGEACEIEFKRASN